MAAGQKIAMIKTRGEAIFRAITCRSKLKKISNLIDSGLPRQMRPALEYLVTGKPDPTTASIIKLAEDRRSEIASQSNKKIPIWYSPKPGSSGTDTGLNACPRHGKIMEFTSERIARLGKTQRWGTALYLIAKGFESSFGLELGTCAGISAIYLSSAPGVKKFMTVEGSEALAEIAQESLKSRGNVKVINSLFEEAIDSMLQAPDDKIDLVYIDGHHEKVATIHYFNKLVSLLEPRAVVIFHDISWSYDMREAWELLSKRTEFSQAMDLGMIGVCIIKTEAESSQAEPTYWNLQPIVGKRSIGDPHGWKK